MNISVINASALLWLWFLGCSFSWRFGKVILVEGTGLKGLEFKVLILFSGTILLCIPFPTVFQWFLLAELILWLVIQFLCHWRYTIFGVTEKKLKGYNECFKGTLRIFPESDTRLIPDLYHIILHLLIAADLILVLVQILNG